MLFSFLDQMRGTSITKKQPDHKKWLFLFESGNYQSRINCTTKSADAHALIWANISYSFCNRVRIALLSKINGLSH